MMGRGMTSQAKSAGRMLILALLVLLVFFAAGAVESEAYAAEDQKTGTVVIDALNVRNGAGTLNQSIGLIYMGDKVTITGSEKDYTGTVWYEIEYDGGIGYVSSDYIALDSNNEYVYDPEFEYELDVEGFPESYKAYLRQLHADYPHWIFQAAHTGLDWTDAVDAESRPGVTLITGTAASSWKSTEPGAYDAETGKYIQYDSGNWVTASRAIIEHYMDPRNFLNSGGAFQFLAHSYDGRTQNAEGLQGVLNGTFMSGEFPEDTHETYNDVLMEVGELTDVNPYVLASMILVEQGSSGIGKSISGTVAGYEGYYNHFNVGAYASGGMDAVTRGLWYASQSGTYERPWDSIYQSIYGGASFYSENYVQNNKYTLYLKKFNVLNGLENVGKGQYMTNVQGAESEAAALRKGYLGVLDTSMTFIIPVYENMPPAACLKPTSSASNDNYLASLTVGDYELTPVFDMNQTTYTLELPATVKSVKVSAKANNMDASVSGTGEVALTAGENVIEVVVTAASGVEKVYTVKINCISEDPTGSIRAGVETTTIKLSSVLSEDGEIVLSWKKSAGYRMDYYQVFRSIKKNSGYGTKAYYTTSDAEETNYADSGIFEAGNTYYYKVRGVRLIDGEKVYTTWSNKAWRTIKEVIMPETPDIPIEPENPETPDDTFDDPDVSDPISSVARGVMATTIDAESALSDSGKIRIDWKKSPGFKVDRYEVFRSVGDADSFGDTAFYTTADGSKLYYVNTKNLKDGVTYYYKVRGVRTVNGKIYYTCWSDVTGQMVGEGPADVPQQPQEPESDDPTGAIRTGIEATKIDMSSSITESGKIRIDWSKTPGYEVDYFEVFRSTERYKGYGSEAYFVTKDGLRTYYINTKSLESGKTYYYKVRGVRLIDGEKVYTQWSNKSWRTIK